MASLHRSLLALCGVFLLLCSTTAVTPPLSTTAVTPPLKFSGYLWVLDEGIDQPGNNIWSATAVTVDQNASLRIDISPPTSGQIPAQWNCGRAKSPLPTFHGSSGGYGNYSVVVRSSLVALDTSAVFSMSLGMHDNAKGGVGINVGPGLTPATKTTEASRTCTCICGNETQEFSLASASGTRWSMLWQKTHVNFEVSEVSFDPKDPKKQPVVGKTLFSWTGHYSIPTPSKTDMMSLQAYLQNHTAPVGSNASIDIEITHMTVTPSSTTI